MATQGRQTANQTASQRPTGRPRNLPVIEARIGARIEHHVMAEMAAGKTIRQVAEALGIGSRSLRRYLHQRFYRVDSEYRLVRVPGTQASKHVRRQASNVGQSRGIAGDFPPGAGRAQGARRPAGGPSPS